MAFSPEHLANELRRLLQAEPSGRFCVAFSGGVDSTVLMQAMAALAGRHAGLELRALHVEHGLHPDAGAWARHCQEAAARFHVPLRVLQVRIPVEPPQGLEAAARDARYAALEAGIAPGEMLLTAQHRDDQAETLLLQLLRGAGPRGLAGMPATRAFGQGAHLRPLLDFDRGELVTYARQAGLEWLEDPANRDDRFARSYLRLHVMPLLRARWPAVAASFARAAGHQAEANALIEQTAARAARSLLNDGCLRVDGLSRLDVPLRREVLRHWIRDRGLSVPSSRKLGTVLEQMLDCRPDATPCVTWPGAELRRYRNRLYLSMPLPARGMSVQPSTWLLDDPFELPAGLGSLHAQAASGAGIRLPQGERSLQVAFRRGGERIRPAGAAHRRPLKKLLQEQGIVPWMRDRLPLLYFASGLAAVADLWVAHAHAAQAGEAGWRIEWRDHPPLY